jgi:NAD(P)-dependent dehydrogenase (short-subunit alcohol dehydrogenase family)
MDNGKPNMSILGRLAKKVCVVTGSAQGIGHGIASVMAENGAHVILWDVAEIVDESANTLKQKGFKAFAQQVDVANPSMVEEAVHKIGCLIGSIDILPGVCRRWRCHDFRKIHQLVAVLSNSQPI